MLKCVKRLSPQVSAKAGCGKHLSIPVCFLAAQHYAAHKGKPFYDALIEFTVSGPVVAMVIEADDAVALTRRMMGSLDPAEAQPGTIRGDLTVHTRENLIHGADSLEAAEREIALWFPELK